MSIDHGGVVPAMALVWCLPARAAPTRTLSLLILGSLSRAAARVVVLHK
jgi:hypothetical protein